MPNLEKKILGASYIYWVYFPLLYLFLTINGHIFRFAEMGIVDEDSAVGLVSGMYYIYLPILMSVLLMYVAYTLKVKNAVIPMGILGLFFSSYISYDILGFSHTSYVLFLGTATFVLIKFLKIRSLRQL